LVLFFFVGNQYHPFPSRKRDDDDDNHLRTSSVSSTSAPITQPLIEQSLSNNPSTNIKVCVFFSFKKSEFLFFLKIKQVDLSPFLSQMTINDICDCLKNDIIGLKPSMISIYIQDINENNISGRVLSACELDELKQV